MAHQAYQKKALLIMTDSVQAGLLQSFLVEAGYEVQRFAALKDASQVLLRQNTDEVFLGVIDVAGSMLACVNGLKEFRRLRQSGQFIRWILYTHEDAWESRETLRSLGVLQCLPPQSDVSLLKVPVDHFEHFHRDPFVEVMDSLEFITGVQLKNDKRSLVESRLQRRLKALKLKSFLEYSKFFHSHLENEIHQAISLITTHTTEFFREESHFGFLRAEVFPKIFAQRRPIKIWSAAASTGQEVYSLAISLLEYAELHQIPIESFDIRIYGSDIDSACLKIAQEGIYKSEQISALPPVMVQKYFDRGQGALEGYVRIKNFVHRLCHFLRLNLLTESFPFVEMDLVFLRNTMIYFNAKHVAAIATRLASVLKPEGVFILGHSESLSGLDTPFESKGNSIYTLKKEFRKPPSLPTPSLSAIESRESPSIVRTFSHENLILIGASTGGVEALRVLLENFPPSSPPILIVQHIPSGFSAALAKRLNETCAIEVSEAKDGDVLENSHAYIAPGGRQMKLRHTKSKLFLEINDDPPVGPHKPSVDYLFQSSLPFCKSIPIAAALLTGMGRDGAQGLRLLRQAGAHTIAQNEETSVVFGMPGTAISLDAAREILPLDEIAGHLLLALQKKSTA